MHASLALEEIILAANPAIIQDPDGV